MNNVINFVSLQRENFCQSSSNLIQTQHSFQCLISCDLRVIQWSSNHNWIKVIMSKLSSLMSFFWRVIAEHSSIWIPLSDCGWICGNGLLYRDELLGSKHFSYVFSFESRVRNITFEQLRLDSLPKPPLWAEWELGSLGLGQRYHRGLSLCGTTWLFLPPKSGRITLGSTFEEELMKSIAYLPIPRAWLVSLGSSSKSDFGLWERAF